MARHVVPPSQEELDRVRELAASGRNAELLFLAVEHGRIASISTLLSNADDQDGGSSNAGSNGRGGAKADLLAERDSEGATPLHRACLKGQIDVVRTLLAAGARSDLKWNGKLPIELMEDGKYDVEPFETALLQAVCLNDVHRVIELLDGKVDANSNSVICWAAAQGLIDIVRELVERGSARLDSLNETGKTALELAETNNQPEMVKLLRAMSHHEGSDSNSGRGRLVAKTDAGRSQAPSKSEQVDQLESRCRALEAQLAEQHELVAGLRSMLNTVLKENGAHELVLNLQAELKKVKEEARMLAESSFRHLGMRKNSSRVSSMTARERMCSADIGDGRVGKSRSEEESSDKPKKHARGESEKRQLSTLEYFIDILGLYEEVSESEESEALSSDYDGSVYSEEDNEDLESEDELENLDYDQNGFTGRNFRPITV